MKLRKIMFGAGIASLGLFTLASCGDAKDDNKTQQTTQVNPATQDCVLKVVNASGTTDDYKVEATDDATKVTEVVEKMLSAKVMDSALAFINGFEMGVNVSASVDYSDATMGDLKGSFTLTGTAKAKTSATSFEVDASFAAQGSAKLVDKTESPAVTREVSAQASADLFTKGDKLYAGYAYNLNLNSEAKAEDEKVAMDMSEILEATQYAQIMQQVKQIGNIELPEEELQALGYTQEDFNKYIETGYFKVTEAVHEYISMAVSAAGLKITTANGAALAFKGGYQDAYVELTVAPSTLLPTKIVVDSGSHLGDLYTAFVAAKSPESVEGTTAVIVGVLNSAKANITLTFGYDVSIDTSAKATDGYRAYHPFGSAKELA